MPDTRELQLPVLHLALAGDHEQRPERGDDEEPVRQGHPHRQTPGDRPDEEAGRHRREVEDGLALQPDAVGEVDAGIDAHRQGELSAEQRHAQPDGGCQQEGGRQRSDPAADHACRHRPVMLVRMQPVHVAVEGVVHEVGAAGGEAEDGKGDEAPAERRAVRQDPGGAGRREDEDVLDPLAWPGRPDQTGGEPYRGGLGGGVGIGNRLRPRPRLGPAHTPIPGLFLVLKSIASLP